MNKVIVSIIMALIAFSSTAQTLNETDTLSKKTPENLAFNYKQLLIPAVLIGYGAIGLQNDGLQKLNRNIRSRVMKDIDKRITVDDFSQYTPALSVYVLNNLNIKGKNNLQNRSVILGTSMLIIFTSVTALKRCTNIDRPDDTRYAFPSGHTAIAFAGAEFLFQEYKDKSCWYGVAGYGIASITGAFRIYNNKHWLTDVTAGAGIGILSTKLAYWVNPFLNEHIFKTGSKNTTAMFTPYYDGKQMGGALAVTF
ncbi:phosphatase PAP2 family protein [Flavobacterium sp. UBA4197]|uniref:phosphatase PAP2 family protein n=1 Tax=Flavobacterium sp. UBA4197 TaxID=1946546 RepID=UPI00257DCD47|nr:phosphatase PAP2 family protein [Flavobacterium sp. UBA4197]